MRHKLKGRKLNRTSAHRKALLVNLAQALVTNECIQTTLPKAKELRPYVEKMVTLARIGSLHARRILLARLRSEEVVKKLIDTLATRYQERPGGYTRILKAGFRYGDRAPLAIVEFVDRPVDQEGGEKDAEKSASKGTEVSKGAPSKAATKKKEKAA